MPGVTQFDPTNPLAQVQAMMKGRLDSAEAGQTSALGRLRAVTSHETPVEASDSGPMWGAIAGGLSAFEPTGSTQDFSRALAGAGGMYGKELARQFKENRGDLEKGANLEFEDASKRLTALEGKYASALTGNRSAIANPWSQPLKVGDGQWVQMNKLTGEARPLASNDAALYQQKFKEGLGAGMKLDPANALSYAEDYANSFVGSKPPAIAAGPTLHQPKPTQPFATRPSAGRPADFPQPDYQKGLQERLAVIDSERQRFADNPLVMESLNKEYADTRGRLAQRPQIGDQRIEHKEGEGFAGEYGKNQAKKAERLSEMGGAARSLMGTVNVMEKLYLEHGDDIPEGVLAPHIDAVKSSFQSLGVPMAGTGATDIVKAFGTEQALKARTADGNNLLPGAMSNYEDRLLQSMAPGLTMTKQGRMLMLQIIKGQMTMKAELSDAAHDYIIKHRRLDSGWDKVATEIAKKNPLLDSKRIEALERSTKILLKRGGR